MPDSIALIVKSVALLPKLQQSVESSKNRVQAEPATSANGKRVQTST
jgi:hypothetical protein